jgi:hypothetical protein
MSEFLLYEIRDSQGNRLAVGRTIDDVIKQLVVLCENYKNIVKDLHKRLDDAKSSEHSSSSIQKLLYIGDSGTGKTTSLFSLLQAGYKLRIYDFDNLLSPLISITRGKAPELLDNIEFMSFRDEMATTSQGPIVPSPRAFTDGLKGIG